MKCLLPTAAACLLALTPACADWGGQPIPARRFKTVWPSLTETYLARGQSIHLQYAHWQWATLSFLEHAYKVNVSLPVYSASSPAADSATTGRPEEGWPRYKMAGMTVQGVTPAMLEKLEKRLQGWGVKTQKEADTMLGKDGTVVSSIHYLKFEIPLKQSAELGVLLEEYFANVPADKAIKLHLNTNAGASILTNRPR